MSVFETMFRACCQQIMLVAPPEDLKNVSSVEAVCKKLTSVAMLNHITTGVLDFEKIVSVDIAWWIYGLFYIIALSLTLVLNVFSIHILLDASMRSPTTYLLAVITLLDLLTCLVQSPLNIHVYLLERYRELPSYIWCEIYNYVHNFLPAALHSAAFLLNMFLSVQRCAGIRDMKRLRVLGTYRASIAATLACVLFSFSIHTLYPVTIGIENVTAISKKVVSASGYDYIQSCRVVPRFKNIYVELYSSYLWLRVSLLQIIPAIIITVCNITLIQASYKTYAYRKRLVGALGIIADSNTDSLATSDTLLSNDGSCGQAITAGGPPMSGPSLTQHQTERAAQIIYTRRSITTDAISLSPERQRSDGDSVNKCFRERRFGSEVLCTNAVIYDRDSNKRFSTGNITSFSRSGKVAPLRSVSGILEEDSDWIVHIGCRAQNRHFSICALPKTGKCVSNDITNEACGCHEPVVDRRIEANYQQLLKSANLFAADRRIIRVHKASESPYFENNRRTSCAVPGKKANNIEVMRRSFSHFGQVGSSQIEDSREEDKVVNQQKASFSSASDISFVVNNLRPDPGTICMSSDFPLTETSLQARHSNSSRAHSIAHAYINNRFKPILSTQHSITSISAEVRSSIMLILVTSCTLIAEVFVAILLILLFLNNFVWPKDFLSHAHLSTAIMVSNAIVSLTFPLNFVFFYGLSQAFRSALTARLRALVGRRLKTSDYT